MKTMRNRSRFRSERNDRSILARSTSLSTPSEASRLLLVASKDRTIPPKDVYGAMRALDRARIAKSDDFERMAGERGPGRAWRLVFTSSAEQIRDEMRGKGRGGGTYFPLVAGQQWDPERMMMRNGVFLGHWASMIFEGPVEVRGTKMRFDFYDLEIRVGPWKKSFRIKQPPDEKERKLGPFFVRCYVDEDIMVMRGKGGGIALWSRATEKDLKEGLIFS